MGFKSSAFAIAQTTRFKRKMRINRENDMKSQAMTPPATPFNNTSFLIHLQQHRHEQLGQRRRALFFDQYGSMEDYMINYFNSFPISGSPSTSITDHSPFEASSDAQACDSGQGSSCSGDVARLVSVRSSQADDHSGDDVHRHDHHSQATALARDHSASHQTSIPK